MDRTKIQFMKRSKKVIIAMIICGVIATAGYIVYSNRVIGSYYGSEYEYIRINNDVYELDANNPYLSSDRWLRLGRVVSETDPSAESMYIWSVKGSDEYIYRVWGIYDGGFYRKVR